MGDISSTAPAVGQGDEPETLAAAVSSLEITANEAGAPEQENTSHRSHDPQFNQKRSDPFQFGSRYLQENDDVFEFNAWDHVETDDTYKEYADQQYAMQRESPVSDFDKCKFASLRFLTSSGPLRRHGNVMIYKHSIVHLTIHEDNFVSYSLSSPSDLPLIYYYLFCIICLVAVC
jgi:hypothetical protein